MNLQYDYNPSLRTPLPPHNTTIPSPSRLRVLTPRQSGAGGRQAALSPGTSINSPLPAGNSLGARCCVVVILRCSSRCWFRNWPTAQHHHVQGWAWGGQSGRYQHQPITDDTAGFFKWAYRSFQRGFENTFATSLTVWLNISLFSSAKFQLLKYRTQM